MKKLFQLFSALLLMLVASVAFASTGEPSAIPDWAAAAFSFGLIVVGLISQVDAQVSEEFKRKWPWWLRLFWDTAAGNYKHSQNIGSV
ncbi:hypothetical protein TW81_02175 [Vibrio galatheae]|uniref:Holin n=1 Tax=Vibrio galatheae TaxID=579748 RepID=A0A0F4NRV0_9VIBR|nr:hypothetical protein [Vibrio galatheae]KJY84821.1 hypothetical protein TW81_02175 [Vibrio galatheae]